MQFYTLWHVAADQRILHVVDVCGHVQGMYCIRPYIFIEQCCLCNEMKLKLLPSVMCKSNGEVDNTW